MARQEQGFTFIEVMVAIVILLVGVLATTTLLSTANATSDRNQARNGATNLVRDIVEASRSLPYDQANPTKDSSGAPDNTIITALQTMQPTSGGSAFADADPTAGWQINRRGVTYTINLQACVIDDAKDKVAASHSPAAADGSGYYCPDLPSTPLGDSAPDDYRRVKVTASWTSSSCGGCGAPNASNSAQTYSVSQTGIIINPTGGLGPAPKGPIVFKNQQGCLGTNGNGGYRVDAYATFADTAVGADFSVNDGATPTTFTATVPDSTDAVNRTKTFLFSYFPQPAPPDNTYTISADGFDSLQHFGPVVVKQVYINCREPAAPTTFTGGFDWRRCTAYPTNCAAGARIFDLDWRPNNDADVLGYYVYRVNGGQPDYLGGNDDTRVACVSRARLGQSPPTTTFPGQLDFIEGPFQPTCWDTGVPAPPALGVITDPNNFPGTQAQYWVQTIDPDPAIDPTVPGNSVVPRPNPTNHSALLDVTENMLNLRPSPPLLTVTNSNGQPCLSWTDSHDVTLDVTPPNKPSNGPVRFYRIYRDSTVAATVAVTYFDGNATVTANVPDVPYSDRIGRTQPNQGGSCNSLQPGNSWFKDEAAGNSNWNYWVTAVDDKYLESVVSNTAIWIAPAS